MPSPAPRSPSAARAAGPPLSPPEPARGQRGQASVELVALLPVIAVVAALLWQCAVAAYAAWAAGAAARSAARAHALGGDVQRAARRRLPSDLERGLVVRSRPDGSVTVTVTVPGLAGQLGRGTASATAHFADQAA